MHDSALTARLPVSSFYYRLKKQSLYPNLRTYLSFTEEQIIFQLITRFSDRSYSMSRDDVALAVQDMVRAFPIARQKKLAFVNGKPGKRFVRIFARRHSSLIEFGRASKQEQARWRVTNAQNFTHQFAEMDSLIQLHNLDPSRIANLSETGTTARNDCRQWVRNNTCNTRGRPAERQSPELKIVKRITMMPAVFANGDIGRPLFVLQGTRVIYRTTLHHSLETSDTLVDSLPRGSVTITHEDVSSWDSRDFCNRESFLQRIAAI